MHEVEFSIALSVSRRFKGEQLKRMDPFCILRSEIPQTYIAINLKNHPGVWN